MQPRLNWQILQVPSASCSFPAAPAVPDLGRQGGAVMGAADSASCIPHPPFPAGRDLHGLVQPSRHTLAFSPRQRDAAVSEPAEDFTASLSILLLVLLLSQLPSLDRHLDPHGEAGGSCDGAGCTDRSIVHPSSSPSRLEGTHRVLFSPLLSPRQTDAAATEPAEDFAGSLGILFLVLLLSQLPRGFFFFFSPLRSDLNTLVCSSVLLQRATSLK